jgi:hypothetical protein
MPDKRKTLEQTIADIEFNLKNLLEEIIGAHISWEERLSLTESTANT